MDSKYQITYRRSDDQENESSAYQETAASVTKLETYQYGQSSSKYNRERKRWWTKFILTVSSAVLVGTVFGLILVSIFRQQGEGQIVPDDLFQPNQDQAVITDVDEEGEDNDDNETDVGRLSAFVIQAGAFQSLEQAKIAQENFLLEKYPSVIWETDTDYRVFLAAYPTKEIAKQVGEQFIDGGFDVYARDWQSDSVSISQNEAEWLNQFKSLWQDSLSGYSDSIKQEWLEWFNVEENQLSEELNDFCQQVKAVLAEFNERSRPYDLLVLWYHYQQLAT